MAENRRNRPEYSDDAHASQRNEPSDPLAELARLIGQSDPFTDIPRGGRKPPESFRAEERPAPPDSRTTPEWLSRPSAAAGRGDYAPASRYVDPGQDHDQHYQDQHQDEERAESAHDDPHDEHAEAYADDGYQNEAEGARREYHPDGRYQVAPPPPDYENDGYYEDGHMPPSEENYAPARRRGGLVTVAAVIGLAVVGTAGAFAYRSFTGTPAAPAIPPVIKADPAPVKVAPPSSAAVADPNKPFQDRISGSAERVVPREEQPVSLPVPPRPTVANPQTAFAPSPGANNAAPMVAPPAQPSPAANEPKRVRTQVFRPSDLAATEPAQPAQPAQAAPQPPTSTRGVPPLGKQPNPMTIAPQSETPAPSSRTKMAARTPAAQAAGGPYVVQVSAQKTEDEARASYQSLQQKYPGVLGGREATIRRADLGQNQTWYRVQIGSFATSEQATTFCTSLKDAGGQCIVQKNN